MKRWWIELELLDDIVLSRRAATQGDHESLDRIPGSVLRGWCANQLYAALGEHAWTVFHSGRVRWLDGLPRDAAGHRSTPVPLSWHSNKADANARAKSGGFWHGSAIFNLARADAGALRQQRGTFQPQGLRTGYVGSGGQALETQQRYRLLTAIGHNGQVAEGQLFGYESLCAGQHFVGVLEIDETDANGPAMQDLERAVLRTLNGTLRLGRSRSAQYGRVRSHTAPAPLPATPTSAEVGQRLHVLLISDACLRRADGSPTLTPSAEALNLPAGVALDTQRSFLRSRRRGGWNAYRNGPELERQVLSAGGVITLTTEHGFDQQTLAALSRGIGCDRALGLGEVLVQPAWLLTDQPSWPETPRFAQSSAAAATRQMPDSALLKWLAKHAKGSSNVGGPSEPDADRFIRDAKRSLCQRWQRVRQYKAIDAQKPWGPGASQWGALAQAAARARSLNELRESLLGGKEGIVSRRLQDAHASAKEFWDEACPDGQGQLLSLAHWVQTTLSQLEQAIAEPSAQLDTWQRLCDEVRKSRAETNAQALDALAARAGAPRAETAPTPKETI